MRPPPRGTITAINRVNPDRYDVTVELLGKGTVVIGVEYFQSSVINMRSIRFDSATLDEAWRVAGMHYPALELLAGGYADMIDRGEQLAFPIDIGDVSQLVRPRRA